MSSCNLGSPIEPLRKAVKERSLYLYEWYFFIRPSHSLEYSLFRLHTKAPSFQYEADIESLNRLKSGAID